MDTRITLLKSFGFTGMESDVYLELLKESGMTGYRIAQNLGKPVSNTYKALESLLQKGAVTIQEMDQSRLYAALPIEDFLSARNAEFQARRRALVQSLQAPPEPPLERSVHRIENRHQLFVQARRIIGDAKVVAVVDGSDRILAELAPDLERAAQEKTVLIRAYTQVEIPGCRAAVSGNLPAPDDDWQIEWIQVNGDGREYLSALLDPRMEQVLDSLWTRSPFLSMMGYNGFITEYLMMRLVDAGREPDIRAAIDREIEAIRPLFTRNLPDVKRFISRFRE